jgi:hypothetical protein
MTAGPNIAHGEIPDRLCTWCKVPMNKRLVGGKQFVHYTCPKCIFQHTTRLGQQGSQSRQPPAARPPTDPQAGANG